MIRVAMVNSRVSPSNTPLSSTVDVQVIPLPRAKYILDDLPLNFPSFLAHILLRRPHVTTRANRWWKERCFFSTFLQPRLPCSSHCWHHSSMSSSFTAPYNVAISNDSPTVTYFPYRDGPVSGGWNLTCSNSVEATWIPHSYCSGKFSHRTTYVGASLLIEFEGTAA